MGYSYHVLTHFYTFVTFGVKLRPPSSVTSPSYGHTVRTFSIYCHHRGQDVMGGFVKFFSPSPEVPAHATHLARLLASNCVLNTPCAITLALSPTRPDSLPLIPHRSLYIHPTTGPYDSHPRTFHRPSLRHGAAHLSTLQPPHSIMIPSDPAPTPIPAFPLVSCLNASLWLTLPLFHCHLHQLHTSPIFRIPPFLHAPLVP